MNPKMVLQWSSHAYTFSLIATFGKAALAHTRVLCMVLPCLSFLTDFHNVGEEDTKTVRYNEGNTDMPRTMNGMWKKKCGNNIVGSKHKHWQVED